VNFIRFSEENSMLALFAQRGGAGAGGPGGGAAGADAAFAGMMTMMIVGVCVVLLIAIGIACFYCMTLSKALKQVRPGNRDMEPGQVWLVLIPLFNLYWNFKIASDVPSSLRREFRDRGIGNRGEDYGAGLAKWYAICSLVNFVGSFIPFVNIVSGLFGLVGFVMWIIFWVKIAGYSKELREGGYDDDDGDDDDDDDRPRKRRSRDDDEDDDDDRPRRRRRSDDDDDE
jgi:hypothetical protein